LHALSVHVGLQGTYLFFPYFVKRRSSSVALWRDIPCSLTMLDSKVHNSSIIALGRDVFVCACLPPVNKNSSVIVFLCWLVCLEQLASDTLSLWFCFIFQNYSQNGEIFSKLAVFFCSHILLSVYLCFVSVCMHARVRASVCVCVWLLALL